MYSFTSENARSKLLGLIARHFFHFDVRHRLDDAGCRQPIRWRHEAKLEEKDYCKDLCRICFLKNNHQGVSLIFFCL